MMCGRDDEPTGHSPSKHAQLTLVEYDPDFPVTCTQRDGDGCAEDPLLGRCDACGYVYHDIPSLTDNDHGEQCRVRLEVT